MKRITFIAGLFIVAAGILLAVKSCTANKLFRNGKSDYQIVLPSDASESEKTAARELQEYIQEISGATLPVTNDEEAGKHRIFVGFSPQVAALTGEQKPDANDEGFTYRTVGRDLLIWGGSQRGTMYGVFTFLEKELGIHWLTSDCTVVPKRQSWTLSQLNHSEQPAIAYRYSNYAVANNVPAWSAHTRENTKWTASTNEYGNLEAYYGAHTMGWLVPAEEFYATHPEYFSLRDGKRMSSYGQLCLSNPEVLELCKTRLKQRMRENPGYRIYSLSQNDNFNFCQCEKCQAI
ncbi:MAG: DUF4838 domain-containing protein, partial [Bacteroidaceae bacterium]|nr:DUF4838 domain-containing protein [Bacteroidaceae bacterium]